MIFGKAKVARTEYKASRIPSTRFNGNDNVGKGENKPERSQGLFLSGEDLTCQAGLAVQQDLALVSLLGLSHVERNGHH